jgi:hypothetical protein
MVPAGTGHWAQSADRPAQVAGSGVRNHEHRLVCDLEHLGGLAADLRVAGSAALLRLLRGNGGRARPANASHYAFNILLPRDGH